MSTRIIMFLIIAFTSVSCAVQNTGINHDVNREILEGFFDGDSAKIIKNAYFLPAEYLVK
jgi:hypothetical protein